MNKRVCIHIITVGCEIVDKFSSVGGNTPQVRGLTKIVLSPRILHLLNQSPWRSSGAPGSWRGVADKSLNDGSRADKSPNVGSRARFGYRMVVRK